MLEELDRSGFITVSGLLSVDFRGTNFVLRTQSCNGTYFSYSRGLEIVNLKEIVCLAKVKRSCTVKRKKKESFAYNLLTRKHTSRMRTARLLTISRSIPCIWGYSPTDGYSSPVGSHPQLCEQTHTCENISFQ